MLPIDIAQAILVPILLGLQAVILKIGLREFSPFFMVSMRFTIMFCILLPFLGRIRQKWRPAVMVGLTQGVGNHALLYLGLLRTDVSSGMIVYQANVIFSVILGVIFLRERVRTGQVAGLAIAFLGVVLVIGGPRHQGGTLGLLMVLGAALAFAAGNVLARKNGPMDQFGLNSAVATVSAPLLFAMSLLTESNVPQAVAAASWQAWAALLYTALVGGTIGFLLWYRLLNRYSVDRVAPFGLLMPVFAMLGGVVLLGEHLSVMGTLGAALAIAGVAIAQIAKRRAASLSPPSPTKPAIATGRVGA